MHNKFNMRALVVPFTLLCWISLASAQSTKLAVGYSGISADQLVIWVAKDTGIFAKNNIDAQTIYFSGGTLSVTAMISGDTPVIQASGPGIVSAGLAGTEPIYVVGGIVSLDYWLMTQPEIKTAEQLKGGTIAVARCGGAADFVARYALASLGLTPGKDVTIVQTGSTPERMAAMETRRVSGSALVPPSTFAAQKKGFLRVGRCRGFGLGLSASRRGHHPEIFARASRRGAKLRQVLYRSGTPAEDRSHHRNENRRKISAFGRQRIAAEDLRKLDRREQAAHQTVSDARRDKNHPGPARPKGFESESRQAAGLRRRALCRRIRQERLPRQTIRAEQSR